MQLNIYKTLRPQIEKTFCSLVEKCYSSNSKVVAVIADDETRENLNKLLWTYSQKKFIPHGSNIDPLPDKQPVYLADKFENPNKATVLISVNPTKESLDFDNKELDSFERTIIIYSSDDPNAAEHIESLKSKADVVIYEQTVNDGWRKL